VVDEFGVVPEVREVPDPAPPPGGAVVRVEYTGLCRSDWHAWKGYSAEVVLPHVPGHEFAGTVAAVGSGVTGWREGDRVTAPFVCACGRCPACLSGDHQVCERQRQPGFDYWGSYADYVVVPDADVNLVRLPDALGCAPAAALGCRYATAFRALVAQARLRPGEWLAVYGCGGVGLSAVQIGVALGARVVAVDVSPVALDRAGKLGAAVTVDAGAVDPVAAVVEATEGGAHVATDALGSEATCDAALRSLRRRGRHVQIGLLSRQPVLPVGRIIGYELEVRGSHGMAAHAYPELIRLVTAGVLRPDLLVTQVIPLDAAPVALSTMDSQGPGGIRLVAVPPPDPAAGLP
jgi:D-arabinose 1-dehydrogenase-like Zn-dependent alcohol dehydrogenase